MYLQPDGHLIIRVAEGLSYSTAIRVFFPGEALETRSDITVTRTYKNVHSVTYVNIYSTMFQKFTDLIISGKISVEMPG